MIRNAMWMALGGLLAWAWLRGATVAKPRDGEASAGPVAAAEETTKAQAVEIVPSQPRGAVEPGAAETPSEAAVPGGGGAPAAEREDPVGGAEELAGLGAAAGQAVAGTQAAAEAADGVEEDGGSRHGAREAERFDALLRVLKAYEEDEGSGGR